MKKFKILLILFLFLLNHNSSFSHVNHYGNLKYLEYELYLNNALIGSHKFHFKKKGDLFYVVTDGHFKVNKLGINLMNYHTETEEIYQNGQLLKFTSNTTQNDKKKYVNLTFNKKENIFEIDGSSFKGKTGLSSIVGSWWNHSIINKKTQISAVSGRIIPQKVKFLGKKAININNKNFDALHFQVLSDDNKPDEKKKINLHIWYDKETLIWIKMSYNKLGRWEYRLKKQLFY